MEPGRRLGDLNKSNKMNKDLFASDWSAIESRTGWPPDNHEILNICALLATATCPKETQLYHYQPTKRDQTPRHWCKKIANTFCSMPSRIIVRHEQQYTSFQKLYSKQPWTNRPSLQNQCKFVLYQSITLSKIQLLKAKFIIPPMQLGRQNP